MALGIHPHGADPEQQLQVDKTWRQVSSQKYRSILDLLGKKAMGRSMDLVTSRVLLTFPHQFPQDSRILGIHPPRSVGFFWFLSMAQHSLAWPG